MTTVAYRDGVIAADTKCTDLELDQTYYRTKLRVMPDAVIGESGEDRDIDRFCDWWARGRPEPRPKIKRGEVGMIVAYFDGRVEVWTDCEYGLEITEGYCAVGSGGHVALGAMYAGADAVTAVEAAIAHQPDTGGSVDHIVIAEAALD